MRDEDEPLLVLDEDPEPVELLLAWEPLVLDFAALDDFEEVPDRGFDPEPLAAVEEPEETEEPVVEEVAPEMTAGGVALTVEPSSEVW